MRTIPVKTEVVDASTGKVVEEKMTPFGILPPPAGQCQECGRAHDPSEPHDKQQLYYQYAWREWTVAYLGGRGGALHPGYAGALEEGPRPALVRAAGRRRADRSPWTGAEVMVMMKALTIWQPWASLIMIGAKPLEFRKWDYRERYPGLVDARIVIHAAAREIKPAEIYDLIKRCEENDTSLIPERALPLLRRIFDARKCRGVVNLSAALGTARLCKPRNMDGLFKKPDSDRLDHHMFGWPLKDIQAFIEPVPMNGLQGFWNAQIGDVSWREVEAA